MKKRWIAVGAVGVFLALTGGVIASTSSSTDTNSLITGLLGGTAGFLLIQSSFKRGHKD
ncbi:hypothetical protein MKY98_26720 [Paenibacillus sp. FSL M8-0228]|uniref:hypothetical protein n=1 Tax=Paenibacillus TaxID=44249 RepID=UPI00159F0732|nr:hypothetical protein [Paenibacillus polymyxa]MBO3287572.1 hypothetical protein [Paenibacillus polymyxa]URJ47342.1 hypothetical protein MF628_001970 [Paenibacillus polymyxa]